MFANMLRSILGGTKQRSHATGADRFRRLRAESLENRLLLSAQPAWMFDVGDGSSSGGVGGSSTVVGPDGDVYVAGAISGVADFDPGPDTFTLDGSVNPGYVARYTSDGDFVSAFGSFSGNIAVDTAGNVYATAGDTIRKYDGDGNVQWTATVTRLDPDANFPKSQHLVVDDRSLDPSDWAVYVVGRFNRDTQFGEHVLNAKKHDWIEGFVTKIDANTGEFLWAEKIGGGDFDEVLAVDLDGNGNVYIAAKFRSRVRAGDFQFNAGGSGFDILVAKLDPAGNFLWAGQMGAASSTEIPWSLKVEGDRWYVTGEFYDTADFDPGSGVFELTSDTQSSFVVALDLDGNFVWARQMNAVTGGSKGNDVTVDSDGNVFVTGWFYGTTDFGGQVLQAVGTSSAQDAFVTQLDAAGNFLDSWRMGATWNDSGSSIAADASGGVYATGSFRASSTSPADFPTGDVRTGGGMYLIKFASFVDESNIAPTADAGGPYFGVEDAVVAFDASASSDLNVDPSDLLTYTWDFGDGTPVVTTTSPSIDHTYVAAGEFTVTLVVNDTVVDSAPVMTNASITDSNANDLFVSRLQFESNVVFSIFGVKKHSERIVGTVLRDADATWNLELGLTSVEHALGHLDSGIQSSITSQAAAPNQQFAMAAPLDEPTASSDTKPERPSRRGSRDEVFSRLARTDRRHRAANTPLRRLQAAAIDRAMADEVDQSEMQRDTIVSRRTRRVRR